MTSLSLRLVRGVLVTSICALPLLAGSTASAAPPLQPCTDSPGLCGSIDVPLDRANPLAGTTAIGFTLIPHGDPAVASQGTILAIAGGPGISSTSELNGYLDELGPLLDARDLLLVDARGTGRSGAIDCQALQHGVGTILAAVAACGAQLGSTVSDYGTPAVADDIDAVRIALGIDRLDVVGTSYGGLVAEVYAIRHPAHLRTLTLDAPGNPSGGDFWQVGSLHQMLRTVDQICRRSPSCGPETPDPTGQIAWLAKTLREHPLVGDAYDAGGQLHHVVLDETKLITNVLTNNDGGYLYQGEISAAAAALRAGDPAPLLRIAAQTDFPAVFDEGDPSFFSIGLNAAVACAEWPVPWQESAPPAVREAQYGEALQDLPAGTLAPFGSDAWSAFLDIGPTGDFCTPWPITRQPAAPAGPGLVYPAVPTLVLSGEYDLQIPNEQAQAVAARFPGSQFVVLAKTGHTTLPSNGCARGMVGEFIESAGPVDPTCSTSFAPGYAVGRFAVKAADAAPARVDPGAGDASTAADRRIATAAWSAAYDALQQGFVGPPEATALGLRGGRYHYRFGDTRDKVMLNGVRFTSDVAVSGHTGYDYATGTTKTLLDVSVSGRDIGRLKITGQLFPHSGSLTLRGRLNGHRLALLVPTA
jgi:pimeloyl-ACP methyl ester carboxylesterase